MAISLVGVGNATTTSVTLPTHQAGDLLIAVAIKWGSGSPTPTVPSGWTTAHTDTSVYRRVVAWKVAASSSEVSGTWTNAADLWVMVWRDATIGAVTSAANSTLAATPALTLTSPPSHVAWLGTAVASGTAGLPTGMTSLWTSAGTYKSQVGWTASPVSSWASQAGSNQDTATVIELIPTGAGGTADLSGAGELANVGTPSIAAGVAAAGDGTLGLVATASVAVPAGLSGSGQLSAVGEVQALPVALSGSGQLVVDATPQPAQAAGLSGAGQLGVTGAASLHVAPDWATEIIAPDRTIDSWVEAISVDGTHLGEVPIDGVRISFKGTQTERWSVDFSFSDPALVPYMPSSWLDGRSGVRLRVWWRVITIDGILERPVCTVVVEDPSGTDDGLLSGSVSGLDPLAIAKRGGYGSRTISVGGMTVSAALATLFEVLVPGYPLAIEDTDVVLPAQYDLWDRSPSEDWTDIASLAGMVVRTDRMGVITVGRQPEGGIVADWSEGPTSPVIKVSWSQSTSAIPRRVVVVSTNPDVVPPIVGVWEHPDIASIQLITETRVESSTVTTQEGADSMAKMTGERWARRQLSASVVVPQRPDLDYRDQVILTRSQSQIHGVFEVSGWDLSLGGRDKAPAPMTVTLMTRLGG